MIRQGIRQSTLAAISPGNFGPCTDRSNPLKETNSGRTGDVETVMSRLKATILCIDDHWNGLIGRKMLLESNGYQVLEATGGDAGLKVFPPHSVGRGVPTHPTPGMNGEGVAPHVMPAHSPAPPLP